MVALMFLHRGFFAQAMTDFPSDPLRSPLGQSFTVAYKCASSLITATESQYEKQPVICSRLWRVWSYTFSSAVREYFSHLMVSAKYLFIKVIVGTVATRRLGIKLNPDPFETLEKACSLFTKVAQTNTRAEKALVSFEGGCHLPELIMPQKMILLRLRQKAFDARIDPFQHGRYLLSSMGSGPQDEPDELEVFGGRTRLVRTSSKIPPSIQLLSSTSTRNIPQYQRAHHHPHFTSVSSNQDAGGYTLGDATLGLAPELEGLYRGGSGPQYSRTASLYDQQSSLILEDRWSSFMHNTSLPLVPLAQFDSQAC